MIERKLTKIVFSVAFLISSINLLYADVTDTINSKIEYQTNKFKYILETAAKNHKDTFDIEKAANSAFDAMLKSADVQSAYFSTEQMAKINEQNKGKSLSVGIKFSNVNDTLVVYSIQKNSPGDSAGIKNGDKIIYVNGKKLTGADFDYLTKALNPSDEKAVELIVKHENGFLQDYAIIPKVLVSTSLNTAIMIPNTEIGYISLNRFSELIDIEFRNIADSLLKQGAKSFIIDLRGNPGGYLDKAVNIVDEFIPEGKTITFTKAKNDNFIQAFKSKPDGLLEKYPIVVVIDKQSASASEILAAAIQDLDRGLVVGEKSFGKGTIQRYWNFKDGSAFKLTVGEYRTAIGREIEPDRTVSPNELLDPAMKMNMESGAYKSLLETIAENGGKISLPVYTTKSGRTLLGGGKIMPDYPVRIDTNTILFTTIAKKGLFLEYGFKYALENKSLINSNYNGSFSEFLNNFRIDTLELEKFGKFVHSRGLWNEAMWRQDKPAIATFLKAVVAQYYWDTEGFVAVRAMDEEVVRKAVEIMPLSKELFNKNK